MASGLLFDPLKLLRLAPLITSTATLMYAHDQHLFFGAWTHESYRKEANTFLPRWFKICLQRAIAIIFTFYPITMILAGANIFLGDPANQKATNFYYSGLAFTFGHFLFGKWAMRLLGAIENDESKGNSTTDMRSWLAMNMIRSVTVDLLGFLSYLMAAMASLKL